MNYYANSKQQGDPQITQIQNIANCQFYLMRQNWQSAIENRQCQSLPYLISMWRMR